MQAPNFIIGGAPKCGTTALYEYLQTHPQVFLTNPKEPHYYAEDLGDHRSVFTHDEYQRLYAPATEQQTAVGEASVWYLHSSVALSRVKQDLPDVRLIILLRQPIDFLCSLHSDLVWVCFEDEPDFETAWNLQQRRRVGQRIPKLCQVPWFLEYQSLGQLGGHICRLLKLFSREQLKILLFEDLIQSPGRVYEEVLTFLGLPSDGRSQFPRVNQSKRNRSTWLARCQATVVQTLPRPLIRVGKRLGLGHINRGMTRLNSQVSPARPLREGFRQQLIETFRDDTELLSQLIGRDLGHWKI